MKLGFPILIWPRMLEMKRSAVAIAVGGGFAAWILAVALMATTILPMPEVVM